MFRVILFFIFFSSFTSVAYVASAKESNLSQMEIRISDLEEQLRNMYGKIEEMEFRYQELEKKITTTVVQPQSTNDGQNLSNNSPINLAPVITPIIPAVIPEEETVDISTPEKHYQYAFDYLSKKNFPKAREMFESFINKYPNDELTGNVYYWIGETYYAEKDFSNSVKMFKAGYEKMPKGLKASDNLLKLALSLKNLEQPQKACVIYEKIMSDKPPSFIADRVKKELKTCK